MATRFEAAIFHFMQLELNCFFREMRASGYSVCNFNIIPV